MARSGANSDNVVHILSVSQDIQRYARFLLPFHLLGVKYLSEYNRIPGRERECVCVCVWLFVKKKVKNRGRWRINSQSYSWIAFI